jgi:signal recognition particle subunit SRP19
MSRRAAIVEEFDDDTDLPLPSQPLPNTGSRGPLLEELHIDDDQFDFNQSQSSRAGQASSRHNPQQESISSRADGGDSVNRVTDITPYKSWTCIYPIYLDAKRPYASGQRRVARAKGLWWPLSKDIADAASRLGFGTLHEVNKSHPRDWENPGRVRVQWKKDGKLINPVIGTKKQLLEIICFQLQHLKPENIPKPPYHTSSSISPSSTPIPTSATPRTSSINTKGKQPVSKSKPSSVLSQTHITTSSPARRPLPSPPTPLPPLNTRVSPYSPAISTGMLIDTVKAGMAGAAAEGAGGTGTGPGGAAAGGMAGKGKRKVVRMRG